MKTLSASIPPATEVLKRNPAMLAGELQQSGAYIHLKKRIEESIDPKGNPAPVEVTGLNGSLSSILAWSLFSELNCPILLVSGQTSFEKYENDLGGLLPNAPFHTISDELPLALGALVQKKIPLILSSFDDLLQPLSAPSEAVEKLFTLTVDKDAGYEKLQSFLADNGFEQREFVEDEGEFSVRGSIVDVYSFGAKAPLRIEFFGNAVSSLRTFDINSQLSQKTVTTAELTGSFIPGENSPSPAGTVLADYLPLSTVVIIDDNIELSAFENTDSLEASLSGFRQIRIKPASGTAIDFHSTPQEKYNANFRLLASRLQKESGSGHRTVFAASSRREIEELADFIAEEIHGTETGMTIQADWIPVTLYTGFTFGNLDLYTESDIFGKFHTPKGHHKRKIKGISLKDLQKLQVGDYVVHENYGIGRFKTLETISVGNSEQECVLVEYDGGDQLFVNIQNINLLSKYTASEGSLPSLSKLGSSKWGAKKDKVRRKLRDIAINLIKIYAKRKMTEGFGCGADTIFTREFEASFVFDETPDQLKAIEEVKKDMQESHPMDRLICGDAGFGKTEIAMRAAFKAVESKKQVAILTPTTILAHQHAESFTRRFENFPISIAVLSRFVARKDQEKIIEKIKNGQIDIVIGTHRLVSKDVQFKDLGLLVIDEEQHFGVEVKEKLRDSFPAVDSLTMSATPIPRTLQFSMLGARDLSIVSTPPKNRQPVETIITGYDPTVIQSAIRHEMQRDGQVFFLHNRISGLEEVQQTLRDLVPYARIVIAHGQMPSKELEKVMMDFMQKEIDVLISTSIIGSGLDISNANTIIINRADMFGLSDLYQLRGRVGRSERKASCYMITPPLNTLKKEAVQRLAVIESFTELGSGFTIALRDLDIRGAGNLLGAEQSGFIHELGFDLYQKMLEETVAELKSTEFYQLFSNEESPAVLPSKPCDLVFFFDALIPDYYISAIHERFAFYEKISRATSEEVLDTFHDELKDRFGALPEEVANLLLLAKLKIAASAAGIDKIDIQQDTFTMFLPDQTNESIANRSFFHYLFQAVQEPWLQNYKPGFKADKKMKLVLRHPKGRATSPAVLLQEYRDLLKKLDERSKETESSPA